MPIAQSAGVRQREVTVGGRTISGASFGYGAFVGGAEWGPFEKAQLVFSFEDFKRKFGSFIQDSYLAYAVKGFFDNGGGSCYVSRVCAYSDQTDPSTKEAIKATVTLQDRQTTPADTLDVTALYEGSKGDEIEVQIEDNPDDSTLFDLTVIVDGESKEKFEGLHMDENTTEGFIELEINEESKWITVTDLSSSATAPDDNPAVGTYALNGGDNGLSTITDADYIGTQTGGNGLYAFDPIDALFYVAIPGQTTSSVWGDMIDYCAQHGFAFAILDPRMGEEPATFKETVDTAGLNSTYGAIHYPNIGINTDFITGKKKVLPPSGHLAGLYARVAFEYGIWESPAGVEQKKGKIYGADFLEFEGTKDSNVRDALEPSKINCIVPWDDYGITNYGGYTLDKTGKFPFINERLTFLYCELSIYQGTQWVVWRNNSKKLWKEIKQTVSKFLIRVWKNNGLKGDNQDEAFDIQIDEALNPPETQEAGELHGRFGLATHRPAVFVWFDYYRKVQSTQ